MNKFWRARRILSDAEASGPFSLTNEEEITFDASFYAAKYVDLKNAFGSDTQAAYNLFYRVGFSEGGRKLCLFFAYKNNKDYYIHYLIYGIHENRVCK